MNFLRKLFARSLSYHGHQTRKDRERALYLETHNKLAASVGKTIPWRKA